MVVCPLSNRKIQYTHYVYICVSYQFSGKAVEPVIMKSGIQSCRFDAWVLEMFIKNKK